MNFIFHMNSHYTAPLIILGLFCKITVISSTYRCELSCVYRYNYTNNSSWTESRKAIMRQVASVNHLSVLHGSSRLYIRNI